MSKHGVPSLFAAALVVSALLLFGAAPAFAIETHAFTGVTIGPGGKSVGGKFGEPMSVAVDPSNGDLYVLDVRNKGRLYKFDSEGEPLNFTGTGTNFIEGIGGLGGGSIRSQVAVAPPGAVGGTAGDIYVANGEVLKIYSAAGLQIGHIAGPPEGPFMVPEELCGVAVDAGGNILTKSYDGAVRGLIHQYTPTANPPTDADESGSSAVPIRETCNLATDSKGHIYAAGIFETPGGEGPGRHLQKLQSLTAEEPELFDPNSSSVAIEPVTDDVYVSHGTEVVQYAEDGSIVARFGEDKLVQAPGLSVGGVDGDVYVSNSASDAGNGPVSSGRVDVFGPLTTLPKALAETPEDITKTSAVLHGTIDADGGPAATCEFEYTTQADFQRRNEEQRLTVSAGGGTFTLGFSGPAGGAEQTTAPIAFNASAATVQAALEALPNIGKFENVSTKNIRVAGGPGSKTGATPYTITFAGALGAEDLEQISVDPTGLTEAEGPGAEVQTVTDGHPGGFEGASSAPCSPAGPFTGNAAEAVSAEVSGLAVGTEYRFRLVGSNENGSLGSDENGSAPGRVPSFETLPAFNVQTGAVSNLSGTSVTLTGSINPEGVSVGECFFEYGGSTAYGNSIPCEAPGGGEIGSGNAPIAVHAAVTGLTEGAEYHYRLVGGSSEFGGVKVRAADAVFGTLAPPQILSQGFSKVGQSSANISGAINPHSSPTIYFVEYVTQAAFEESGYSTATKVPAGGASIGSGFSGVEVSQALSGLAPGTKYHFRLYAENSVNHREGKDAVFTTQGMNPVVGPCPANEAFRVGWSADLPDCRADEQASSLDKNGDSVAGLYPLLFASEDGSAVTFYSPAGTTPAGERGGTQNYPTYLARRDAAAGSWSSQRLLPPQEVGGEAEYLGSTPDLRYAVVEAGSKGERGLFVIDTTDGAVTQIVPYQPVGQNNNFGVDGASADGSRIFFESKATLSTTPEIPVPAAGHGNLYMWERSTGHVSLVGVLPDDEGGNAPAAGSFGGAYEWYENREPSNGGALNKPGNAPEPLAVAGLHAISPNGDQIFFTAAGSGQLYLRRALGGANPTTLHISTPNAGVTSPAGEFPAAFLEATPDGSRAFFMSREKLTSNAASGESPGDNDLYRWDASAPAGQALTDVAPNAEVQGLLGVNHAGNVGYFIAHRVLAANAEAGRENLYRFAEKPTGGFRITLIAILAKTATGQEPDRRNVSPKVSFGYQVEKTSRLSEDGERLLFTSTKQLTGYDNINPEGISCENGECPELYIYSAASGKLTCVSCDPTGETPVGGANFQDQFFDAFLTPNMPPVPFFSRNFSTDGTRVFFQTPDPLVAADANGAAGCPASGGSAGRRLGTGRCQDVYEWEAVGSGTCQHEEANGGCLYLLSTGQSGKPSYFVGASEDGSNAFIATDSQLVPSDHDQVDDVYDVRVDGGLASQSSTPAEPCRSSEACKGPGSTPASGGSPGSLYFEGPGNRPSKKCKKGFVRRHGKCVKKPKHRHHRGHKRATGKKRSGGAK